MSEAIAATGAMDRAPPTGAPASDIDPFSLDFFADPFRLIRSCAKPQWTRHALQFSPHSVVALPGGDFLAFWRWAFSKLRLGGRFFC